MKNLTELPKLVGLCILALAFSFSWLIFYEIANFLIYALSGSDFCIIGQPCMMLLSLVPGLAFTVQIIADALGALFILRTLVSHGILARDSFLAKTAKVWLLTMILFVPVFIFSYYLQNRAIKDCDDRCGGSIMCEAHCPGGSSGAGIAVIISAIIGVHNPVSFLLTGHLAKKWIGSR